MKPIVVTPYLTFHDCAQALRFYAEVFAEVAVEEEYLDGDGRIAHATVRIDGATLYVSDEYPDYGALSPQTLGGSAVALHVQVGDAQAVAARMVAAGGKLLREVQDQPDGERRGTVLDPFGYRWLVGQGAAADE